MIEALKRFARGQTGWQIGNRAQRAANREDELVQVQQWFVSNAPWDQSNPHYVQSYTQLSELPFTPTGARQLFSYRSDIERKFSHASLYGEGEGYMVAYPRIKERTIYCAIFAIRGHSKRGMFSVLKPYWFLEGKEKKTDFMEEHFEAINPNGAFAQEAG